MGHFSTFLYTLTINCVTVGARNMLIEYRFCFICSEQCIQIISLRKKCVLLCSAFKETISNDTTPTFQEVGGVI